MSNKLETKCKDHWQRLNITYLDSLKDTILAIFDEQKTQNGALEEVYKLVFPEWDQIAKVKGFPKVGTDLWQFICRCFIEFDRKNHPEVMPGGIWINNGFSSNSNLSAWEISFEGCAVEYLPDDLPKTVFERRSDGIHA